MDDEAFAAMLHKLDPASIAGFEGLVAGLLRTMTGRRFFSGPLGTAGRSRYDF